MNLLASSAFGLLMVVTAAGVGGRFTLVALGLAVLAVLLGMVDRRAAAVAVVLTITGLALSDPTPLFAAVSGLCAAAYLVTRFGVGPGAVTLTVPTVLGMVGFTLVGLAATAVALPVRWMPLLAPAVMVAILIVVAKPLLARDRFDGPGADPGLSG